MAKANRVFKNVVTHFQTNYTDPLYMRGRKSVGMNRMLKNLATKKTIVITVIC